MSSTFSTMLLTSADSTLHALSAGIVEGEGLIGLHRWLHPTRKGCTRCYILEGLVTSRMSINYGVDVNFWSTGCICIEIYAGKPIMPRRIEACSRVLMGCTC